MVMCIASDEDLTPIGAALAARGIAAKPVALGSPLADAVLARSGDTAPLMIAALRGAGWAGPLMLLVERAEQVVEALDAGADEAVPRAADPAEIAARLNARLRQASARQRIGNLTLDAVRRDAMRGDRWLGLSPREYALLACLCRHRGRIVTRAALLRAVWGLSFDPGTNVVQVHVSRLRKRLDPPGEPPMLATARGLGYRLDPG